MLVNLLDANRGNFVINRKALTDVYVRRGLKRIPGVRNERRASVTEPSAEDGVRERRRVPADFVVRREPEHRDDEHDARRGRCCLVPRKGGKPITQVAGIKLDNLSTFNNYTLVGDGELNVPYLEGEDFREVAATRNCCTKACWN